LKATKELYDLINIQLLCGTSSITAMTDSDSLVMNTHGQTFSIWWRIYAYYLMLC
jgi:hypothetical protein